MSTKTMNSAEIITPDNVKESDVVEVTENVLKESFSCSSVDTEVIIDGETGDELDRMVRGSYAVDVMGKDKSIAVECKGACSKFEVIN